MDLAEGFPPRAAQINTKYPVRKQSCFLGLAVFEDQSSANSFQ